MIWTDLNTALGVLIEKLILDGCRLSRVLGAIVKLEANLVKHANSILGETTKV